MKIIVETVYDNVDPEWLDWWLKRMGWPDDVKQDFKSGEEVGFANNDPSSAVTGRTIHKLEME